VAPAVEPAAATVRADSFEKLLADFPAVVNRSKVLLRWPPSGDVKHHIVTKSPPLSCRFHHKKLAAVKKKFLQMERGGIIRCSNSPSTERKISDYLWRTESANCSSRKYK
jgi:hypothetical protein